MTSLGRLIFFDQPGTGASDPVTLGALPTLEQWADSITAVLDDLGSREAVLVALERRVRARCAVRGDTSVSYHRAGRARRLRRRGRNQYSLKTKFKARSRCGAPASYNMSLNPDMPWNEEIRAAWARLERLAASPRTLRSGAASPVRTGRSGGSSDRSRADSRRPPFRRRVRPARAGQVRRRAHTRARNMLRCRAATCITSLNPGVASFQEIAEFLTGEQADVADDRVLATVLFTDIVDSTRRAAEIGDRDWHALLDAHDAVVRSQLARFRGREVNTSGDGFLAMFDGPQRAIRCAMAIRDAVRRSASRCAPDCTPANARSAATTSAGSPCTSARASAPWQGRTRCSCPARCATS